MVPQAVKAELRVEENLPGCSEIRAAFNEGWIVIRDVIDKEKVKILGRELDRGEAEAIALALQEKADVILLDEREARKISKEMGLSVTGILGVILKAAENGKIKSLKNVLDDLIDTAGFRISDTLYMDILDKIKIEE